MKIKEYNFLIPEKPEYTINVKHKEVLNKKLIEFPCMLFIDQATNSGVSIFDNKKRLVKSFYLKKDEKDNVKFRHKFKEIISNIIDEFQVNMLFCEKVFDGVNFNTVELLISLKETLEDIAYEKNIKCYPLNNKKWKARLAYPNKWENTKNDKEQVNKYVKRYYPNIKVEQDIMDSIGMAIAVLFKGSNYIRPLELQLNKKLPVNLSVWVINNIDDLYDKINQSVHKHKLNKDIKTFDYDTKLDIYTNFRYILTNYDVVAVSEIPYHRNYGQILLMHDIKPSEIGEKDTLIAVATRKN